MSRTHPRRRKAVAIWFLRRNNATLQLAPKCSAPVNLPHCTYEFWFSENDVKYSSAGVARSVAPRATIRRANAVLDAIGVTKVADVTNLDRVGIPNFISVRPHDLGPGISYYNGKGRTRPDAHAGALMEAVERHAAEEYGGPILSISYRNLRNRHPCIDPREIPIPMVRDFEENLLLEWVSGFDLISRRETFVPLNCVLAPYVTYLANHLFYSGTNGLASGNSRSEALCHALCEVIERDSMALAAARAHIRPAIAVMLTDIGFDRGSLPEPKDAPLISLESLPKTATALVRKLQRAGLQVYLRNLTSKLGIATIGCTIVDPHSSAAVSAHGGCGTHPDARIAVTRALTEAAQSRLGWIQGGREDLPDIAPPATGSGRGSHGRGDTMEFRDIPSYEHASVKEDVELLINRMQRGGFDQAVAVDLTRQGIGIPVVRVVVPKAESWPIYCSPTGRSVLGHRVVQAIHADD